MSFYVLSLMEPTTHSIIKLVSRAVAVLSLTLVYGIEESNSFMVFGIFLCVSGACFYYYCSTANIDMKTGFFIKAFVITVLMTCAFVTGVYMYTPQKVVFMSELAKKSWNIAQYDYKQTWT